MEHSVEWVTELLEPVPEQGSATAVPAHPQPEEVQRAHTHRPTRKTQDWKEQWQLLRKREAIALAEAASATAQCGLKPHELDDPHSATPSSGAAAATGPHQTLAGLRKKAWAQVHAVRDAVGSVKRQLDEAQPGAQYVVTLTSDIQTVDQLLSSFHEWTGREMVDLQQQAERLESEIEACVFALEESWTEPATTHSHTHNTEHTVRVSGPQAGPSKVAALSSRRVSLGGGVAGGGQRRRTDDTGPLRDQSDVHRAERRTTTASTSKASTRAHALVAGGGLAPEVVEFDAFVEEHGEWGGWEREDHEAFESILKACGGDYTRAIEAALERCVGYTKSDLVKHACWHMDYMDLLTRKRMAVAAWKAKREHLRAQNQAKAALLVPDASSAPAAEANAKQRAAAAAAAEAAREAALRRQQVMSWKQRKEEAARAAAERAAQAAREAAQREDIERAERKHINRLKLEMHREIKQHQAQEAARAAAAAAEQQREGQVLSQEQMEAVALRNQATFLRRQELLEQKRLEAARRSQVQQQLLQQVQVEAPSDPRRLLKGTQAHMARVKQQREEQRNPRDSDFILHVSHRQTPGWRAGLQGI